MGAELDAGGAAGVATVDWTDLAGLDQVVKAYLLRENEVVVQLADGREIRVAAWLDLGTGRYVAEFEKRTAITVGGRQLNVWAATPAYRPVAADDVQSCLEAAVLEVDRVRVY